MKPNEKARQRIIEKFRTVGKERLQRMSLGLLDLENNPKDNDVAEEVMREIHTLKGEAKMIGFSDVNLVAHKTEDLLCIARDRSFDLSSGLGDMIFKGLDLMHGLIKKKAGQDYDGSEMGNYFSAVDKIANAQKVEGSSKLTKTVKRSTQKDQPANSLRTQLADDKYIRIHMEKLDRLSDLVGDILLTRSRFNQAFDELGLTMGISGADWMLMDRKKMAAISRAIAGFRREIITNNRQHEQLESLVRDMRLVSIASLFANIPRLVRDLANEQKKKIKVSTLGLNTELDKQVLDQLADPLLHVVRNAVDHGIESPEQRIKLGKPPTGSIILKSFQIGEKVEIRVEDDGSGIEKSVIQQAAKRKSLDKKSELDESSWLQLIFEQGFSTTEKATDISGRGVGLDAVKQKIEALGGSVSVQSNPGQGCSFVFSVPVSISISQALLVEAGESKCAIPSYFIERLVDLNVTSKVAVGKGLGLRIASQVIPLLKLSDLLSVPACHSTLGVPAVVIRQDDKMLALQVERVVGEREIILKPLDPFLAGIKTYSGTATLPDGTLSFVLNPGELFRLAATHHKIEIKPDNIPNEKGDRSPTILVVDDSEITRDLVVEIIRAMGYRVIEAGNGQEALNRLSEGQPDLILADIEMPVMDGFQLLSSVKGENRTRDIPVVVLSTLGSEEDKHRALKLGADSYIVKSEFHEQLLFDTVNRFLGR